ncbi:aldehyde dehydrogenase [Yersinia kristensenii]|uniref:aldehyde dehydrogenase n=1 Tax=Yersinia kristensenii TaxID=28152 RepID=UPI000C1E6BCB|nr:aldehyde dehydrogenase [Yersinia kristensenii]MDA5474264.1 aldehyde dehydrogenase [Yersinia kristensenii]MDA5478761.1 aldehyde dehydrogenase [Yersinia kristensenii]MDA5507558.1 aldehyde dehydrogenase [Yersinia kristensenii]NIK97082.1 aldehyde dehydrogenase [Yersinia kristensenii]NIL07931.1 aldehyde dehydrogenase [Yersinia kristensenii]
MNQKKPHSITPALERFKAAKAQHLKNEETYKEIMASIARSQQKQRDAENQSQQADGSWRKLFRSLRGEMTDELQTEHIRRISQRELAQEFGHLIEELELDKSAVLLELCASAKPYKDTHREALTAYADMEIVAALYTLPPELIRAVKIKMAVNNVYGDESPARALGMLITTLIRAAALSPFNIEKETVLAELSLQRPEPDYVDSTLNNSPIKRGRLLNEIKEKRKKLNPAGEQ